MKKYEVRVDVGIITNEQIYYEVEAENEDMARDKAASLMDAEGIDWEYYDTTILTEEEV